MYARENEFDKYFEKASASVGLPTAMMKAIVAVESAFCPTVFNMRQDKIGLSGMKPDIASRISHAVLKTDEPRTQLHDPEANILLLGFYLRFLYSNLGNSAMFPEHGGHDPDYFDVVRQYCRDNESGEISRYVERVWSHYRYFCEKDGEPNSYRADEVEGTYIRKRESVYL